MIFALGWGGQQIIVVRDLQTVIVFTGGNYTIGTELYNFMR